MMRRKICSLLSALLLCGACTASSERASSGGTAASIDTATRVNADDAASEIDAALREKAVEALGGREGTIIVLNPQTGRIRAIVNPRLAFEQAFPPGSSIKPFTALAALRAGILDRETRQTCQQRYTRDGFTIACSHPKSKAPFDLTKALAYSCNYYFATLSERLSENAWSSTLAAFGFGARTGVNAPSEASGTLQRGTSEWSVRDALGEGDKLLTTPIQLLMAYAALINGGHLYKPQQTSAGNSITQERSRIRIDEAHRDALLEGMRGAIEYGTAARAGLMQIPLFIFGKTGTSTASNNFRTQGWFVAFAAEGDDVRRASPEMIKLAVLVFLKRAHGAEGAEIARPILEEYARFQEKDTEHNLARRVTTLDEKAESISAPATNQTPRNATFLTVHLESENRNIRLSLADYIAGVLAAESSVEMETEALKAQAVASRTYALLNRGRHASTGYDFCSTTHCQRFVDGNTSRTAIFRQAVADTEGEVLRDERGDLVQAYFHAACGGMTADVRTLWGDASTGQTTSYLHGVRDDYCMAMPHRNWTQVIPVTELAKALHADPRSDIGNRLDDILVTKRDHTNRAEFVALEGERRRVLRGWDFKLIVGRTLGWNFLKSSRFDVRRARANFIFRGSGFGHGLGLCQEGAHVMAARGASYKQILAFYYPQTRVEEFNAKSQRDEKAVSHEHRAMKKVALLQNAIGMQDEMRNEYASLRASFTPKFAPTSFTAAPLRNLAQVNNGRLSLNSEHFRVIFSGRTPRREVEEVLPALETARRELERRVTAAGLRFTGINNLTFVIHDTTQSFSDATGQPSWTAAALLLLAPDDRRIALQPLSVLKGRGVLWTTLRHELAHTMIDALSKGRAPRWLNEGLAAYVAGEGRFLLMRDKLNMKLTVDELEEKLAHPRSADEMRAAYAAAYKEVRKLINAEGEARVWRRVAG